MPIKIEKPSLAALSIMGLAMPLGALADVTVQQQTTLNVSIVKAHITTTEQIAGNSRRTESELRCEGMMSLVCGKNLHADIVRLDRGVIWNIEPKKQRYVETPFLTSEQRRAALARTEEAMEKLKSCQAGSSAAVDISKCELSAPRLSVQQTDEIARIVGHDAPRTHFMLVQTCKAADPSQACELTYSFDVWLARDDIPAWHERREFQSRYFTQLGLVDSNDGLSPDLKRYLAPYAGAMQQLSEKSQDLKGYPLKTAFRLSFTGTPCGSPQSTQSNGTSAPLAGAERAAADATASSTQQAAGWGAADAVSRSTGSSAGGYVAGSAVGAFAGSLVSGLFARKNKPQTAATATDSTILNPATATTVVELTFETLAISAEPIPAEQFEPPAAWSRVLAGNNGEADLPHCPNAVR
jgi:hypothetical protein